MSPFLAHLTQVFIPQHNPTPSLACLWQGNMLWRLGRARGGGRGLVMGRGEGVAGLPPSCVSKACGCSEGIRR